MDVVDFITRNAIANSRMKGGKEGGREGGESDSSSDENSNSETDSDRDYGEENKPNRDSTYSFSEFLNSLHDAIVEEVIAEVKKEGFYTVLMGSSTDNGDYCEVAFWVRYWKRWGRKRRRRGRMVSRMLCIRRVGVKG
jgi:hypothetical protein